MSLEKAIESGKEFRESFRGSKRFSVQCRNHGSCEWCEGNRLHSSRRRAEAAEYDLKNYETIYL